MTLSWTVPETSRDGVPSSLSFGSQVAFTGSVSGLRPCGHTLKEFVFNVDSAPLRVCITFPASVHPVEDTEVCPHVGRCVELRERWRARMSLLLRVSVLNFFSPRFFFWIKPENRSW